LYIHSLGVKCWSLWLCTIWWMASTLVWKYIWSLFIYKIYL